MRQIKEGNTSKRLHLFKGSFIENLNIEHWNLLKVGLLNMPVIDGAKGYYNYELTELYYLFFET